MANKTKKNFIIIFRYIMIAFFVLNIIGLIFGPRVFAADGFDFGSFAIAR